MPEPSIGLGTAHPAVAIVEEPLMVRTIRAVISGEEDVIALVAALRAAGYSLDGS